MAVAGGAAAEGQCTPEEEAENREQQVNEMDMIQSIFEGQFVLLGQNMEYMVNSFISGDGFRRRGTSALRGGSRTLTRGVLFINFPWNTPTFNQTTPIFLLFNEQKGGSFEPKESPLDPPLALVIMQARGTHFFLTPVCVGIMLCISM